jgi:ABC-type metal ion transport system substrate-binding protein
MFSTLGLIQLAAPSGVTEDDITENAITLIFAEPENAITRKRYNQKMI